MSPATVSRVLKRAGLARLKDLEPAEPARRYVHDNPGDMIHLDIKKLGRFVRTQHRITGDRTGQSNTRGVGGAYLHVCIDDASRIACTDLGGLFPTCLQQAGAALPPASMQACSPIRKHAAPSPT